MTGAAAAVTAEAEVAAVVRKAKELAEADARAGDPDIERRAVDTDPIEARVIDEALKILGPNGEKLTHEE